MGIDTMREAISKVYDTDTWRKRVACMHENQVLAVYSKFLESGLLFKRISKPATKQEPERQLNMFDDFGVK